MVVCVKGEKKGKRGGEKEGKKKENAFKKFWGLRPHNPINAWGAPPDPPSDLRPDGNTIWMGLGGSLRDHPEMPLIWYHTPGEGGDMHYVTDKPVI